MIWSVERVISYNIISWENLAVFLPPTLEARVLANTRDSMVAVVVEGDVVVAVVVVLFVDPRREAVGLAG